jgi:hypothetical protein
LFLEKHKKEVAKGFDVSMDEDREGFTARDHHDGELVQGYVHEAPNGIAKNQNVR